MEYSYPYVVGGGLRLSIAGSPTVTAEIVEVKTNTCSSVMVIELPSDSKPYILKLFDRKFAEELRECSRAESWSLRIENEFKRLVQTGVRYGFFKRWSAGRSKNPHYSDPDEEEWNDAMVEL